MRNIKCGISLFLVALLSACGTGEIIKDKNLDSYSITAKEGIPTGGWDKASSEATEKAINYCSSMGQKYYYINEHRSGTPGFTLLSSTITFNCGADTVGIVKALQNECKSKMQSPELDVIRTKVELSRTSSLPPPFDISTNNTYPIAIEKSAIAKWAKIRDGCASEEIEAMSNPKQYANAKQKAFADKESEFRSQMAAQISALIVALYQSKLTYGEFAQKRYEVASGVISAERDFRAATVKQDSEARARESEIDRQNRIEAARIQVEQQKADAMQKQANKIESPTSHSTNCTTTSFGNTLHTSCN